MTLFVAIILGIIQGFTEFLPVSSSGHLALARILFGLDSPENYIFFDLVCHLGTLLAIFCVFWAEICDTFKNRQRLLQICLGTLPLFPAVLLLKPLEKIYGEPAWLGFFFLTTALFLFLAMRFGRTASDDYLQEKRWKHPLCIGLFQAVALLPGVSRSGATLSSARLLGWNPRTAVSFAFLLAIPAVMGGLTLELISHPLSQNVGFMQYGAGFLTSFLCGMMALRLLILVVVRNYLRYFVIYCTLLSLLSFFLFW